MGNSASEEGLMAAYAAGDCHAFTRLFALLAPNVHAFFLRSFRDETVADELMQDTFLKVHRGRQSYREDLPVRPWVFTIATHVRRDELRRRYRMKESCDEDALEKAEASQAILAQAQHTHEIYSKDTFDVVRAAVDRLPETQRVVVQLHRFEGLTFVEVASVLNTSEGAVRARAFRAYEQLRRDLQHLTQQKSTQ